MSQHAIALSRISKAFNARPVLEDVSLEVSQGEILALLGPNGAGKTTLIRILATLTRPDRGDAWVGGYHVEREAAQVRRLISLTGQHAAVDPVLTGRENLQLLARLAGLDRGQATERVSALLRQFDLEEAADRRSATYSGGMRRRLDLALSLVGAPAVVFLDEPTTGLDPRSRQLLWAEIRGLARNGTTILLTTQYLDEADHLADRVAMLDGGRIVALDRPAALKARAGQQIVALRSAAGELIAQVPTDGTLPGVEGAMRQLVGAGPSDAVVTLHHPSLDDVFFALTGAGRPAPQLEGVK